MRCRLSARLNVVSDGQHLRCYGFVGPCMRCSLSSQTNMARNRLAVLAYVCDAECCLRRTCCETQQVHLHIGEIFMVVSAEHGEAHYRFLVADKRSFMSSLTDMMQHAIVSLAHVCDFQRHLQWNWCRTWDVRLPFAAMFNVVSYGHGKSCHGFFSTYMPCLTSSPTEMIVNVIGAFVQVCIV